MSARSAREDTALQNLAAWDGLARLDSILNQVRSRPNFFLTVPRILRVEGVHSDMLGWLLDPKGWHGLADRFAVPFGRAMLAACKRCGEGALVVEEVHREFSTGKGPINILLHLRRGDERFVLGIENKIDAPEGKNQLRRYGEGLAYTFPGTAVVLTFLTPNGRKPQSTPGCPVASIGYRTIVALLEEALAAPPARGRHSVGLGLARHYCAALRSHIMPEQNPEIDELCRKLYNEHLDAWRAIRRRLPSKRDESHASVGSTDYLREQHPDSRLRSVPGRDEMFDLEITDSLRQEVRSALPHGDPELIQFLARAGEGRCSFTTSPTLAEDDPRLTLLTFYHPLIRTVHRHYLENLRELHPACYVRLHSADLPGGRYGWLLYSSEIGGVQPRRDLEIVALHLQHEDALDEDTSETLLWLMAAQAETVPEARRHQEIDGEFIERAEDLFVSRLNARFSARRRSNEALVANRLASLRETYERNRELREQRVREARERRRQPTYIKGLETRTRTLDAGYHDKVSEIEATREMSRSYNLCAGGIVEIAHGTRSGGSGRRPVSR